MICTVCGKEFPDGSAFCTNCGAPISAMNAAPAAAAPVEPVPVAVDEFKTVAPAAYQDAVPAAAPAPAPVEEFKTVAPQAYQDVAAAAPAEEFKTVAPQAYQDVAAVAPAVEAIQPTVAATTDFAATATPAPQVAAPAPEAIQPTAAAPVYQAAPAAAPAAPEKKKGGNAKFLVPIILLAVLLVLCFILAIVGFALFGVKNKAYNEVLAEKADLELQVSDLQGQISSKDSKINSLTNDLNTAKTDLENAKAEAEEYRLEAENAGSYKKDLTQMQNDIRSVKISNYVFCPTRNVIVLKKGETVNVPINLNKTGQFKFTFNRDNSVVGAEWKNDWGNGGKTCSIDFKAGNTTGRTKYTFTNTLTSDSFDIIIFVID